MKRSDLSKVVGASLVTLSLAIMPLSLPASAQTNTQTNPTIENDNGPVLDSTPFQETRGVIDNWGWLGLLGLLGLVNLFRKEPEQVSYATPQATNTSVTTEDPLRYRDPNEDPVRYRDPNEVDRAVTNEEPVRYRDPNEVSGFDNNETTVRYKDPNEVRRSDTDGKRY